MANFITLANNDKEYTLKLTARSCIALENSLGKNPISVFTNLQGNELPKISDIVAIIHGAIQEKHTLNETYDLVDKYLEDHDMTDLISLVLDIFKASGFIKNAKN